MLQQISGCYCVNKAELVTVGYLFDEWYKSRRDFDANRDELSRAARLSQQTTLADATNAPVMMLANTDLV